MSASGAIFWKGVGNKTIDVAGIKTRFKSLGIFVDWDIFDRISKHRNDVEHYFSPLPEEDIVDLLADCFVIISRFLSDHLNVNARETLGDEAWQILLHAYEVYEHEIESNAKTISSLAFHHDILKEIFLNFSCINCSSPLVQPAVKGAEADGSIFCCAECETKYCYDEICNMGISDFYKSFFMSDLDKSSCPFANCENCGQGLFLKEFCVCTACGCLD